MADAALEDAGGGGCIGFVFSRLIIPGTLALLGALGGLFQWTLEEGRIEETRTREQVVYEDGVVASYVNDLSGLITGAGEALTLPNCTAYTLYASEQQTNLTRLMRSRTLLALSQVDAGINRGQILRFVAESGVASTLDFRDLQFWDYSGSDLQGACLQGFNLMSADFSGTWMPLSDLDNATLQFANFSNTQLWQASLIEANSFGINLSNAILTDVSFEGSNLRGANLSGANMTDARLVNSVMDERTLFSETTILPDGSAWSAGADLERFTDANHPDHWDPCKVYEGSLWFCLR